MEIKKILYLLNKAEKRKAILLICLVLFMAVMDMLGVASILPFIAVLSDPKVVETNSFLLFLYNKSVYFGVKDLNHFLFFLGVGVFIFLITSLSFRAITTYFQIRYTMMLEYSLSRRLTEGYLHQPYSWFLNRHSADLSKSILSEVGEVVGKTIYPIINITVYGAVSTAMLVLIFLIDTKLALQMGFVLVLCYGCVFYFIKKILTRIGNERLKSNTDRYTAISEALGAIKEVKIGGLENVYTERFEKPAKKFAITQSISVLLANLPRYLIEAVAFGGMIILILVLMNRGSDFANIIPVITLYALAGYRLIPSLQQIYHSSTQLRFSGPALNSLYSDLKNLKSTKNNFFDQELLEFNKNIKINNIFLTYPNSNQAVLKNISLEIKAKSKIGIVGSTGSGKTTLVDFILGLLSADNGSLSVDGKIINQSNLRSWQKIIGYVPQQVYLVDDSIRANIAFGVQNHKINQHAVEEVAKIANIHEFIIKELPNGYDSIVGERGVRLSGGQLQRIGIARAIYHNPKLLILDEATSALDNITERDLMDALLNIKNRITIIMIAHRLSTIKSCDEIILLDSGEIKAKGSYANLDLSSDLFKKMAKPNN